MMTNAFNTFAVQILRCSDLQLDQLQEAAQWRPKIFEHILRNIYFVLVVLSL